MKIKITDLRTDAVEFIDKDTGFMGVPSYEVPKGYKVVSVTVYETLGYVSVNIAQTKAGQ